MGELEGDNSSEIDYAKIRAQQLKELGGAAMGRAELSAYHNGFPPTCTILNPAELKEQHERGTLEQGQTPMEKADIVLTEKYGPQKSLALTSTFGANANQLNNDIGGLIVTDPSITRDI